MPLVKDRLLVVFLNLFREFGRSRDGACGRNNISFCEEGISHFIKKKNNNISFFVFVLMIQD
jgi:hypothetical protein